MCVIINITIFLKKKRKKKMGQGLKKKWGIANN